MSTRTRQVIDYRESGTAYTNTYVYKWAGGGTESYGPQALIDVQHRNDSSFITREKLRIMTDEIVENYYARSRAGEVFINPMTSEHIEQEVLPGMGFLYFKRWPGFPAYFFYKTPYEGYLVEPDAYKNKLATAVKQASTQAMSRVTSEEMLLLATIGELKESKEMLVNAAKRLLDLRKPLKNLLSIFKRREPLTWKEIQRFMLDDYIDKFDASKASSREIKYFEKVYQRKLLRELRQNEKYKEYLKRRRIARLKAIENAWMEIRMGWRPFFGEIQNLIKAINSSKDFPKRQTFRGKSLPIEFTYSDVKSRGDLNSWYTTEDRTFSATAQVRSGVLARMRTGGWPDTYGLTKIPQTIWELTTLSWAVDYFFNVGEVIAAYVPDTLWEVLGAWSTVEETIVQIVTNEQIRHPDFISGFKSGTKVRTVKRKKRIPGSSIAVTFRPRMNVAKYIDIMAVSRQKITPLIKDLMKFSRKRK